MVGRKGRSEGERNNVRKDVMRGTMKGREKENDMRGKGQWEKRGS